LSRLLVVVPIILDQAVGDCSHYFGSGCWLLFPSFWIRLLVTVSIILDEAVGYCSHHFGSSCWLLFPSFWIRLLVTVPIILDQVVSYCSHHFGSGVTNSLIQNDGNSNQQPDPKLWKSN
jgi:hypothetical protein